MLIRAIERSDTISPEAIRQAMSGIRDFPGVTGMISFGPDSRIPDKSVTIMEVRDGTEKLVTEIIPETIPAP